jgi:hypothetical protein
MLLMRLALALDADVIFVMKSVALTRIIAIDDECCIMCRWQLHPSPILYALTPAAYARQTKRLRLFLRVNKCCHHDLPSTISRVHQRTNLLLKIEYNCTSQSRLALSV